MPVAGLPTTPNSSITANPPPERKFDWHRRRTLILAPNVIASPVGSTPMRPCQPGELTFDLGERLRPPESLREPKGLPAGQGLPLVPASPSAARLPATPH